MCLYMRDLPLQSWWDCDACLSCVQAHSPGGFTAAAQASVLAVGKNTGQWILVAACVFIFFCMGTNLFLSTNDYDHETHANIVFYLTCNYCLEGGPSYHNGPCSCMQ